LIFFRSSAWLSNSPHRDSVEVPITGDKQSQDIIALRRSKLLGGSPPRRVVAERILSSSFKLDDFTTDQLIRWPSEAGQGRG